MANGVVTRIVSDKGYGFIKATDGKEFFFHRSGCVGVRFDQLKEKAEVSFDEGEGPKGPRAENVQLS